MKLPSVHAALCRAVVGCLAAAAYAWQQRSLLRAERRALAGLNEEMLCEARLLAFELNKDGDPMKVVQDPCLPTSTPERELSDESRRRRSGGGWAATLSGKRGLWLPRLNARLAVRPNAIRRLLGSDGGTLRTQVIGVCGMSCSGKSTVSSVLRAIAAQHAPTCPSCASTTPTTSGCTSRRGRGSGRTSSRRRAAASARGRTGRARAASTGRRRVRMAGCMAVAWLY